MAKTSMKVKQQRKAKFSTREYSRCRICGRPHAYLRKYGICRICFSIAEILLKEGYIKKFDVNEVDGIKTIHITLKYGADKNDKIITGLKRISKPGLRVYAGKDELPKVLGGLGIAIISTNKGVMTDKEARKENVGGEVLAFIW